jgi:hypothetical protein
VQRGFRKPDENISDVGLGKPVKFVSIPTSGMEELDEMVCFQCRLSDMNLRAGPISMPSRPRLGIGALSFQTRGFLHLASNLALWKTWLNKS